jgi:hypothetical protein
MHRKASVVEPVQAQDFGKPKKSKKRSKKQEKAQGGRRVNSLVLVFGGLGVLLLILGSVVGGYLLTRGNREPGQDGQQPRTAEEARASGFRVFDQPLVDVPAVEKKDLPPLFIDATPFDSSKAPRRERKNTTKPAAGADSKTLADPKAEEDQPRWSVAADPASAREPIKYAADLRIPP